MIDGQALPGAACAPDAWNGNTLLVKRIVDLFYADEEEDPDSVNEALSICAQCPVKNRCLEENLSERHGIWGGTTENERRSMRQIVRMQ